MYKFKSLGRNFFPIPGSFKQADERKVVLCSSNSFMSKRRALEIIKSSYNGHLAIRKIIDKDGNDEKDNSQHFVEINFSKVKVNKLIVKHPKIRKIRNEGYNQENILISKVGKYSKFYITFNSVKDKKAFELSVNSESNGVPRIETIIPKIAKDNLVNESSLLQEKIKKVIEESKNKEITEAAKQKETEEARKKELEERSKNIADVKKDE